MLKLSFEEEVAVLDLDDGKVNAISHDFAASIVAGLEQAKARARSVVLVGRPGRFSAGFDLNELNKSRADAQALLLAGAKMLLRVLSHPQPVVAGCTGHAIAGGALLLLAADARIAASGDFRIGLNETAIGMTFPAFGLELAQYRLSRRYLDEAVVQARLFGPESAVLAGFIDEVVPEGELRARAISCGRALGELPSAAYAGNKLGLRRAIAARLDASLTTMRPPSGVSDLSSRPG